MSDFLTSLAGRAVLPVPAIRPAIRSFYEPLPAIESALPVPVAVAVPVEPPRPRSAGTIQPPDPPPVADPLGHEDRQSLPARADAASEQPSERPVLIHSTPGPISAPPMSFVGKATRPQPTAPVAKSEPAPPSPTAVRPVPVTASTRPRSGAEEVSPVVPRPAQVTPRENDLPASPVPVLRPTILPPAAGALPRLPQPQRSPRASAPLDKSPFHPPPAPIPAPEVTITIGRVEIRTAAAAAATPAPTAAGPRLSLEAYLRRGTSRSA